MTPRRLTTAMSVLLIAVAASGCAGQDVAASTHPKGSRAQQVGAATWYLPTTVTIAPATPAGSGPSPSPGSSGSASANDPTVWTVQGSGTWDGRQVKVFARPTTGVRQASLLITQLLGFAQIGGIPTFSSLGGHGVSVTGADLSEELTFSYSGTAGTGQGLWVAAVQSRSALGVVVQVATTGATVDPAFVQKVVDSLEFAKR